MRIGRRKLLSIGAFAGTAILAKSARAVTLARPRVIDVHTHMYTNGYIDTLRQSDDPGTKIVPPNGIERYEGIEYHGQVIARVSPLMLDWEERIKAMDEVGVDLAIISLTAPNVFWISRELSLRSAVAINNNYAEAQQQYPDRIRWFASLPWDFAQDALAELKRAAKMGATGICTLTSIRGRPLSHPEYRPIWREIEAMGLPVFIHPTAPLGRPEQTEYMLGNTVAMPGETSECFARLILSGRFDEFPELQLIASHGGGTLPFLASRLDRRWHVNLGISKPDNLHPPSHYLNRFWYDSIIYDEPTLAYLLARVGSDRVIYGSDFPFRIGDMKGLLTLAQTLPEPSRTAVLSGNAARLFNL